MTGPSLLAAGACVIVATIVLATLHWERQARAEQAAFDARFEPGHPNPVINPVTGRPIVSPGPRPGFTGVEIIDGHDIPEDWEPPSMDMGGPRAGDESK